MTGRNHMRQMCLHKHHPNMLLRRGNRLFTPSSAALHVKAPAESIGTVAAACALRSESSSSRVSRTRKLLWRSTQASLLSKLKHTSIISSVHQECVSMSFFIPATHKPIDTGTAKSQRADILMAIDTELLTKSTSEPRTCGKNRSDPDGGLQLRHASHPNKYTLDMAC